MYIPHCPNAKCDRFPTQTDDRWYISYGSHDTKAFGSVPRFRCKHCLKTFSSQTFSIDYYPKKVLDYTRIMMQLVSASGLMDSARALEVRVETIQNRLERLARCTQGIHADVLEHLPMRENLAADGFESFSYSQYYPNHINSLVGCDSEFIYALGFANLRRKGRMSTKQKAKRAQLEAIGKADAKAIERSFITMGEELVQRLESKPTAPLTLYTDEHQAYPRAFAKVAGFSNSVVHHRISSKAAPTAVNPLFPVNYIDRQFRKDLSDHARQTLQFAHCPSALMIRMCVYRFYHNYRIHRRLRDYRRGIHYSHAEKAGLKRSKMHQIIDNRWGRRVFLHEIALGAEERKTWFCQWSNPAIPMHRYVPKYIAV